MSAYQASATDGRDVHTVRFPAGPPPAQLDVLIVGAGPVGLSSAIELAGRGVRVAVVDRARTADGGSSTVRRLAGIGRDGERAPQKRLRLIVRTGDETRRLGPAPSGVNLVFNARAWGFLAAVSTREWRVYAGPYPLDYEPTHEELVDIGRAAFGFDLDLDLDLEVASATTCRPPGGTELRPACF